LKEFEFPQTKNLPFWTETRRARGEVFKAKFGNALKL